MVVQYENYFIGLLRYTSHIVRDDKAGLRNNIKMIMTTHEHINFYKILQLALQVEKNIIDSRNDKIRGAQT